MFQHSEFAGEGAATPSLVATWLRKALPVLCTLALAGGLAWLGMAAGAASASAAPAAGPHGSAVSAQTSSAQAVITVTTHSDGGAGSLRQAILDAGYWDTIVFAPEITGVITLTEGTLIITNNLTIQGPGAGELAISGAKAAQIFYVHDASLILSGLTLRDGFTNGCGGAICAVGSAGLTLIDTVVVSNTGGAGGGIGNYGHTAVISSSVLDNVAYGEGGGIMNVGGRLFVINSTIRGNSTFASGGAINSCCVDATVSVLNSAIVANRSARHAGGIGIATGGSASIVNTTISGNVSESDGGGGLDIYGTLHLTNSTVVSNVALAGGGLHNGGGAVTVANTILAYNAPGGDCAGPIQSLGHNLSGDASCDFTAAGDLANTDPLLGALADNGGPTPTHLPHGDSPAINAGGNDGCPADDQRGVTRPQAPVCDIGAVELPFADAMHLPHVVRLSVE